MEARKTCGGSTLEKDLAVAAHEVSGGSDVGAPGRQIAREEEEDEK